MLLLLHYAWVVRSNVAFEEASVQASQKLAEKLAAVRAGNWQAAQKKPRSKRPPFKLRPTGPPAVALLWKNLISAGQAFSLRIWISLAVFPPVATVGCGRRPPAAPAGGSALGMIAAMLMAWSLLIGPQLLRQDFRQDLPLSRPAQDLPPARLAACPRRTPRPGGGLTCIQWLLLMVIARAVLANERRRSRLAGLAGHRLRRRRSSCPC